MSWIFGFLLWWCFDDALAASLGVAGLGELPWWVVFLACLMVWALTGHGVGERLEKLEQRLRRPRPFERAQVCVD